MLGFEPRSSAPKAPRITKLPYNPMVVLMGVEPISSVPKTNIVSVRPQDYWSQRQDLHLEPSAYRADALPD